MSDPNSEHNRRLRIKHKRSLLLNIFELHANNDKSDQEELNSYVKAHLNFELLTEMQSDLTLLSSKKVLTPLETSYLQFLIGVLPMINLTD